MGAASGGRFIVDMRNIQAHSAGRDLAAAVSASKRNLLESMVNRQDPRAMKRLRRNPPQSPPVSEVLSPGRLPAITHQNMHGVCSVSVSPSPDVVHAHFPTAS